MITVHVAGEDTEPERAAALLRGSDGFEDVRVVEDSIVIYSAEGSTKIPRIVVLLNGASVRVGEVSVARPTLDDVFLRKTGQHIEVDGERR